MKLGVRAVEARLASILQEAERFQKSGALFGSPNKNKNNNKNNNNNNHQSKNNDNDGHNYNSQDHSISESILGPTMFGKPQASSGSCWGACKNYRFLLDPGSDLEPMLRF